MRPGWSSRFTARRGTSSRRKARLRWSARTRRATFRRKLNGPAGRPTPGRGPASRVAGAEPGEGGRAMEARGQAAGDGLAGIARRPDDGVVGFAERVGERMTWRAE